MVDSVSSNFRMFTAKLLSVSMFSSFTVVHFPMFVCNFLFPGKFHSSYMH